MVIGERKIPGEVVCVWCARVKLGKIKEEGRKEAEKQGGGKGGGILEIEDCKTPDGGWRREKVRER